MKFNLYDNLALRHYWTWVIYNSLLAFGVFLIVLLITPLCFAFDLARGNTWKGIVRDWKRELAGFWQLVRADNSRYGWVCLKRQAGVA